MSRRRLALAVVAGLLLAGQAAAQEPWRASYYPYPLKGPNDKLTWVLHYQYAQAADYYDRVPFANSLSAEAGANPDGSRFLVARFKGPRIAPGWRLSGEAGTVRENRYGFFGLGNETEASDTKDNPYADRVGRTRHSVRGDLTRTAVGPLQVAVGGSLTRANFRALPGNTKYAGYCPQLPVVGGTAVECASGTDLVGRVALILDTRNLEFVTAKGVLLEAGALVGSGGSGYNGVYGQAKAFVSPREGMVFAARILGRHLSDEAPLDARTEIQAWEQNIPVLGGPETHRSFVYGRFTGQDVVVLNLEYRQDILNLGDFGAFTAVGFLDAGSVKEAALSQNSDLHVGGGAGLALRILRSTVLTFNFAWGGDGFLYSMGTGWMF